MKKISLKIFAVLVALMLTLCISQLAQAQSTREILLMSVNDSGVQGNLGAYSAAISADGRFIAFESHASNLVSNDTNSSTDIFVHDRQTGTTERVSIATGGTQADASSEAPAISGDGRFVVFQSDAANLVAGDTNGNIDIFVHDRQTNTTTRVSVDSSGAQANDGSENPQIALNGEFIAFWSYASNLVAGDTNGQSDIFVHELATGITTRVSIGLGGAEADNSSFDPCLSEDGRYVVFRSEATNLVSNDTNNNTDIFIYDRQTGTTERVSIATGGAQGNGGSRNVSISANGRWIVFDSYASNLVSGDTNGHYDVFMVDRQEGTLVRVSVANDGTEGNANAGYAQIAAYGGYIAFEASASNLVSGDTNNADDIFLAKYVSEVFIPLVLH